LSRWRSIVAFMPWKNTMFAVATSKVYLENEDVLRGLACVEVSVG
jgi:hypothetical protein